MELPALKVGKPRPTPVVRGGITEFGYDNVSSVIEISKEEASNFFDMENEQNFPVFGI